MIAFGIEDLHHRPGVLQVVDDDMPADHTHAVQHILGLGDDLAPVFRLRVLRVDYDQAILGCAIIGAEIQIVADIADQAVVVVEALDDGPEFGPGLRQVLVDDRITVVRADRDRDDEMITVVGHRCARTPVGLFRNLVHQFVLGLRRADAVEPDLHVLVERLELLRFRRRRITAVVEARAVSGPGEGRELEPLEPIAELLAGLDVQHLADPPVRAAVLHEVGDVRSVGTGKIGSQRDSAVLGPRIRIDQ